MKVKKTKVMTIPTFSKTMRRNLVIVIITLIVGFSLGLCYAHIVHPSSTSSTSVSPIRHFCNCPMIPAHQDAADFCHC
jgi:flagellar basal body-associated protein FliL